MLIGAVAIATVSLTTLDSIGSVRNIASITFVLVCALGFILIRSVRREVEQREEIQRLADSLRDANTKLKELDVLKSQFLSIATHELRTPITIVRNFVSLMLDGSYGKVPPAAEVAARQVLERATDMAHSVDSYLNVSRIEQGKMQYTFTTVDITRLTKLAVDGMKANADKKSLALSLTIKPGAEEMQANADGPKISEVLVNLIDNSIKYTPKGSVAVTVEKIGKVGRITIRDTGVGMTQKTMQGLFKLFSPGEDAKKVNVSSTGIGMYISKTHVEAHKGTLNGYSEGEGKGSQFVLDLPLLS
jgi:signal transduction histidine kinase